MIHLLHDAQPVLYPSSSSYSSRSTSPQQQQQRNSPSPSSNSSSSRTVRGQQQSTTNEPKSPSATASPSLTFTLPSPTTTTTTTSSTTRFRHSIDASASTSLSARRHTHGNSTTSSSNNFTTHQPSTMQYLSAFLEQKLIRSSPMNSIMKRDKRVSKLALHIEGDRRVFVPGQMLQGSVSFNLSRPTRIQLLQVELLGSVMSFHSKKAAKACQEEGPFEGTLAMASSHSITPIFEDTILLLGSRREGYWGRNAAAELKAGQHEFPISFQFPYRSIPASFEGDFGEISYWLKANLVEAEEEDEAYRRLELRQSRAFIKLAVPSTVDVHLQTFAREVKCQVPVVPMTGSDETMQVFGRLPKKAYTHEETIPVSIKLDLSQALVGVGNPEGAKDERQLHVLSVQLEQRVKYVQGPREPRIQMWNVTDYVVRKSGVSSPSTESESLASPTASTSSSSTTSCASAPSGSASSSSSSSATDINIDVRVPSYLATSSRTPLIHITHALVVQVAVSQISKRRDSATLVTSAPSSAPSSPTSELELENTLAAVPTPGILVVPPTGASSSSSSSSSSFSFSSPPALVLESQRNSTSGRWFMSKWRSGGNSSSVSPCPTTTSSVSNPSSPVMPPSPLCGEAPTILPLSPIVSRASSASPTSPTSPTASTSTHRKSLTVMTRRYVAQYVKENPPPTTPVAATTATAAFGTGNGNGNVTMSMSSVSVRLGFVVAGYPDSVTAAATSVAYGGYIEPLPLYTKYAEEETPSSSSSS